MDVNDLWEDELRKECQLRGIWVLDPVVQRKELKHHLEREKVDPNLVPHELSESGVTDDLQQSVNGNMFGIGEVVWRRNFALSDKVRKFSAKLGAKWVKCKIVSVYGRSSYSVQDLNGTYIGTYHQKDLKKN